MRVIEKAGKKAEISARLIANKSAYNFNRALFNEIIRRTAQ